MVQNLSAEVPGYQGLECPCGSFTKEVQINDFLRDNVQLLAGPEVLYLRTEDLTEGPCPVSQKGALYLLCSRKQGVAEVV